MARSNGLEISYPATKVLYIIIISQRKRRHCGG
jgi:hypothetical protein